MPKGIYQRKTKEVNSSLDTLERLVLIRSEYFSQVEQSTVLKGSTVMANIIMLESSINEELKRLFPSKEVPMIAKSVALNVVAPFNEQEVK